MTLRDKLDREIYGAAVQLARIESGENSILKYVKEPEARKLAVSYLQKLKAKTVEADTLLREASSADGLESVKLVLKKISAAYGALVRMQLDDKSLDEI